MRKKLKDCQNLRVRNYQYHSKYVEGNKVWYQPLNGNAWIRQALVVTQRGQSVYLHTHGDLKKIAACRVKPLLMALSANFHFKIASVNICAAFLQSKVLDRDIFLASN